MAEITTASPERERDGAKREVRGDASPSAEPIAPRNADADADKERRRLDRLFAKAGAMLPRSAAAALHRLREPRARWIRIPAALLLMVGGVFSFLPVLGLWMLPLGLLLLAVDVPVLRRPMGKAILVVRRRWATWKRKRAPAR